MTIRNKPNDTRPPWVVFNVWFESFTLYTSNMCFVILWYIFTWAQHQRFWIYITLWLPDNTDIPVSNSVLWNNVISVSWGILPADLLLIIKRARHVNTFAKVRNMRDMAVDSPEAMSDILMGEKRNTVWTSAFMESKVVSAWISLFWEK